MVVRVLEIAGITAPERLLRRFDQSSAGSDGLFHHGIDFSFRRDIVTNREFGRAAPGLRYPCVMGNIGPCKKREFQPTLQIEENNGAMLEFGTDDAFRLQPQAVPVEFERRFEIIDAAQTSGWLPVLFRIP